MTFASFGQPGTGVVVFTVVGGGVRFTSCFLALFRDNAFAGETPHSADCHAIHAYSSMRPNSRKIQKK